MHWNEDITQKEVNRFTRGLKDQSFDEDNLWWDVLSSLHAMHMNQSVIQISCASMLHLSHMISVYFHIMQVAWRAMPKNETPHMHVHGHTEQKTMLCYVYYVIMSWAVLQSQLYVQHIIACPSCKADTCMFIWPVSMLQSRHRKAKCLYNPPPEVNYTLHLQAEMCVRWQDNTNVSRRQKMDVIQPYDLNWDVTSSQ